MLRRSVQAGRLSANIAGSKKRSSSILAPHEQRALDLPHAVDALRERGAGRQGKADVGERRQPQKFLAIIYDAERPGQRA